MENELTKNPILDRSSCILVEQYPNQNSSMILCTLLYFFVMDKVHPINKMLKW